MTHLRKMMLEELQRRNYSQHTIRYYIRKVVDFSRFRSKIQPSAGPLGAAGHSRIPSRVVSETGVVTGHHCVSPGGPGRFSTSRCSRRPGAPPRLRVRNDRRLRVNRSEGVRAEPVRRRVHGPRDLYTLERPSINLYDANVRFHRCECFAHNPDEEQSMKFRRRPIKHSDVDQCVDVFAEHPDFILQYGSQRKPSAEHS